MSLTREFASLGSFSRFLNERVAAIEIGGAAISAEVATTLHRSVKKMYGDKVLPELAQATQDDRSAKGFSADDPLLRDGKLIRDSIEWAVGEDFAAVGTSEPIAAYHEFGYLNKRTGQPVPPRPAFKIGFEEAAPAVIGIMERNLGHALGFTDSGLASSVETGMTAYALDASDKE